MYGAIKSSSRDEECGSSKPVVEESRSELSTHLRKVSIGFALTAILGAAVFILYSTKFQDISSYTSIFQSSTAEETVVATTDQLFVTASNEYGAFSAPYSYLASGNQIVEPWKNTTLTLSGSFVDEGYSFVWTVDSNSNSHTELVIFKTFENAAKSHAVEVKAYDKEGNYAATYTTTLYCKYVKREVRSLTVVDREKFLDAASAIWKYSTSEGRELYGDKFTGIETYVAEHAIASNDVRCDMFHEGSGFLTHHLALQLSFEASLRSVDASVTLPYWDFSIEGETITQLGENPSYLMEITDMFTDTWFGSVDDDHHIQDGRWAHAAMPKATTETMTQNSFGYIRSYWNNNPDSEISRKLFDACGVEPVHKAIPNCKTHYDILNSDTLGVLQLISAGDGHGPMHVQIGGVWGGCNDAYTTFNAKWGDFMDQDMTDEEIEEAGYEPKSFKWGNTAPRRLMFDTAIMGEYFHIYRSFWRSHMCAVDNKPEYLVCPESCDEESQTFEDCTCQVDALISGDTDWLNLFPCVLNSESNRAFFNSTMPQEMLEDLTTFLATASVKEGEMVESASTADIMFWIIHPVIERLVSAKRMATVTNMGGHNISKWAVPDGSEEEWLAYSYYNLEEGQNLYYPEAYTCVGHEANDAVLPAALPLTGTISDIADADGDGVITNVEFFYAMDPNLADGNDYVFDNFNWDHCTDMEL